MIKVHKIKPKPDEAKPSLMMLSMPNSGTDWLTQCIVRSDADLRYYREYFNPITNTRHPERIKQAFGAEGKYSSLIAKSPYKTPIQLAYESTWGADEFNFTKENFSQFKVDFFRRYFECFVFYRKPQLSVPSHNTSVIGYYVAIYDSMHENSRDLDALIVTALRQTQDLVKTKEHKMLAAYLIASLQILSESRRYDIPVLTYDVLMSASQQELEVVFAEFPLKHPDVLSKIVCDTRVRRNPIEWPADWSILFDKLVEFFDPYTRKYIGV